LPADHLVGTVQGQIAGQGRGQHRPALGRQRRQGRGVELGLVDLTGRKMGVVPVDGGAGLGLDVRQQGRGVGLQPAGRDHALQGLQGPALAPERRDQPALYLQVVGMQGRQMPEDGLGVREPALRLQGAAQIGEAVPCPARRLGPGHGRSKNWPYMLITWLRVGPR
jgi:hypothetical protein